MAFSFKDNLLNLVEETKKYLSGLDKATFINLSDNELSFFASEIENLSSKKKIENKKKDQSTPSPAGAEKPFLRVDKTYFKKKELQAPHKEIDLPHPHPLSSSSITNFKPAQKADLALEKQTLEDTPTSSPSSFSPATSSFTLLEKPQKTELVLNEVKRIIKEIAPEYPLSDTIPSDKRARQIASAWQIKKQAAEITILCSGETPQQLLFLKNVASALDILLKPAKIVSAMEIEKGNQWDDFFSQDELKLIIACDYFIWGLPHLIKHYREIPAQHQHFLHDIPLFMLPDISLYFKDPILKKSLWASLKNKIQLLTDR